MNITTIVTITMINASMPINCIKHPPVIILPILRCLPDLVVGIPVTLAILRFALVIPKALLQENERPGIPVFVPLPLRLRLAIISPLYYCGVNEVTVCSPVSSVTTIVTVCPVVAELIFIGHGVPTFPLYGVFVVL